MQELPAEERAAALAPFERIQYASVENVVVEQAHTTASAGKQPLHPSLCANQSARSHHEQAAPAGAAVKKCVAISDAPAAPTAVQNEGLVVTEAATAKQRSTKAAGRKPAASGKREGGHANFVRMANQKGKSSFKYKSKSGSSSNNPKNRKWAARKLAQESLPVAGLGADSTREAHTVRQPPPSRIFV